LDVIVPAEKNEKLERERKSEVIKEIEPTVEKLYNQHQAKQNLWFPNDFLPSDEKMDDDRKSVLEKLRERARSLSDAVKVALTLNTLTEEGLPHFHRLIATYLGPSSIWQKWNFLWTAEEDRHGNILRDYMRDTRILNFGLVEIMQYGYINSGFTPDWEMDVYQILVYTSLQERATQVSHRNTGKVVSEPLLKGILQNIAADEAKHFNFYRYAFKAIIEVDPNEALKSALKLLPSIDMPGISMPNFREMADVVRRVGIYGPWEYKAIVDEIIKFWNIGSLMHLNKIGSQAQEKIMGLSSRLEKVAKYIERKAQKKSFSFDFLYNQTWAMD